MLLDWVTARVSSEHLTDTAKEVLYHLGDRIVRYCPRTGDIAYETCAWDSVRSDSHQIAIKFGGCDLWIQGSPARVIGAGDAVFGAGPSSHLDLMGCVEAMVRYVAVQVGCELPPAQLWKVSRVDVTGNLRMESEAEVRIALGILRDCEGGRYRVSQQAGDTVYWSHKSKLKAGKAYGKGWHLEYLTRQKGYSGCTYTPAEIEAAKRLLRLELRLGREWFARTDWKTVTPQMLRDEWQDYFGRMIGGAEMKSDSDVKSRVMAAAKTEGQGRAAYGCWCVIQSEGWDRAREMFSKTTWYRNLQILRDAGLGDADISAGKVVPLRRRIMTAEVVTSWRQIAA